MLIDERIQELNAAGAKKLLRRAVEVIASRMECHACAMKIVCGSEASEDDCMRQVLVLLAVPTSEDTVDDEEPEDAAVAPEEGVIYYNKDTMKIEA